MTQDSEPPKRALAVAGAVVITAVLAGLSLYLGQWAYDARKAGIHHGRLKQMLEQKPTVEQVVGGLGAEGMRAHEASTVEAARVLADRWGGAQRETIVTLAARAARTFAFEGDGYVYFVFFDAKGTMFEFTFVSA